MNAFSVGKGLVASCAALAAGGQLDGTKLVDRAALAEAATEHAYECL